MSADGLEIRAATDDDAATWDDFVSGHERGTFFHLQGWNRVVERVMGHRRRDLLACCDGELVGVFPIGECRGLRGRKQWISVPYAVYGGPLGRTGEVEHALFARAEADARDAAVARLELRSREDPGLDLPASELYATFARDLPTSVEDVLASMPKKSRAEARKARTRHGLELSEGMWFLDDLLRLFHRNKHALGSPGLPLAWFRGLRDEFRERVSVHLVRRGVEPLAAVMSFALGDTLYAYYSGTAEDADRRYSASNFMYMALQEWCVERGFRRFDFGRSRRDAGAYTFKVHQGFEAQPLHYRYRLFGGAELPSLNPSNPRTKVLRDTWSHLPLWLTRKLSTPASRFLP